MKNSEKPASPIHSEYQLKQDGYLGLTKREWMVGQVAAGWSISQSGLKDEKMLAFGIVEVADLILKRLEETKL